jgi:hypothetical protein
MKWQGPDAAAAGRLLDLGRITRHIEFKKNASTLRVSPKGNGLHSIGIANRRQELLLRPSESVLFWRTESGWNRS